MIESTDMGKARVTLIGTMGNDLECYYTDEGVPVATFSVIVSRNGSEQRFHCIARGDYSRGDVGIADDCWYLMEGQTVCVQGELVLHDFLEHKQQVYTRMELLVEDFETSEFDRYELREQPWPCPVCEEHDRQRREMQETQVPLAVSRTFTEKEYQDMQLERGSHILNQSSEQGNRSDNDSIPGSTLTNDALNAFESTIVEADEWWRSFQDDWLSIHREDICIYRVRLERSGSGWSIAEAWTNGDPEQFKLSLSEKVQLLFYFIDRILLLDKKTGEL